MDELQAVNYGQHIGVIGRVNTRERLAQKKTLLERELGDVNKAIEILDSNPEVETLIDALRNVGI
jgi:arginine/ornithine N-succinyltransferase beta subunit